MNLITEEESTKPRTNVKVKTTIKKWTKWLEIKNFLFANLEGDNIKYQLYPIVLTQIE